MMPGMDARQVALMMRRMGLEVKELEDVKEVIVRTREKEYRFNKPEVSIMKAQGGETWQIQGKVQVTNLAPEAKPAAPTAPSAPAPPAAPVAIPDEDVRMVMQQTGKDHATAKAALEATRGDIAEAIVKLS